MKRRFTVVAIVEQDGEDTVAIDAAALEIQVRASLEETETYGVEVKAVAIVTEQWDPTTGVYVAE